MAHGKDLEIKLVVHKGGSWSVNAGDGFGGMIFEAGASEVNYQDDNLSDEEWNDITVYEFGHIWFNKIFCSLDEAKQWLENRKWTLDSIKFGQKCYRIYDLSWQDLFLELNADLHSDWYHDELGNSMFE